MLLNDYQQSAIRTDVSSSESNFRHLVLGLFGEAGSVLSVVKKKGRDKGSSKLYFMQASEELGDLLWYIAASANKANIELGQIAEPLALSEHRRLKSSELHFSHLQKPRTLLPIEPSGNLEWVLIYLAEGVGRLIVAQRKYVETTNKKSLLDAFTKVLRRVVGVANRVGLSLEEVAKSNLAKTADRWPEYRVKGYPRPFDSLYPVYERLPRLMEFDIKEIRSAEDHSFVLQSSRGVNVGDRLTDNIEDPDDYRFHDVFHYAYAAVIGWSPVLRAILKTKRKSNKEVDQNQDGARAILIEEGLATLVFNHAKESGSLFEDVERGKLSFDLLKMVRIFVRGYEVENVPYWVWEEAILQGFAAFSYLKEHREGRVTIDYRKRRLRFGPIPNLHVEAKK